MHVLPLGQPIAPWGELPADLPVLGRPLSRVQQHAVACVPAPPGLRWVLGDHTWITPALLARFADACGPDGGQLALDGPFVEHTRALQDLPPGPGPVRFPVALRPDGADLDALPPVAVDLDIDWQDPPASHPAFAHAARPLPVTDAMVHTVTHWSHLLHVNLLAMVAAARAEHRRAVALPWWRKAWGMGRLVARAGGIGKWPLAAALTRVGEGCDIHPTAVVEASHVGDGVEIGAHAVVRASWIGDGVTIREHAQVHRSVVNRGAELSRGVVVNLCLLLDGALVSPGFGHQASVFGRDAFVAWGATLLDLSFGREIDVRHRGARVPSGTRFLGVAVGHRARIGPHVIVGYGEAVPNDAFLVTDPRRMFRDLPDALPPGEPVTVRDGAIVPARAPRKTT